MGDPFFLGMSLEFLVLVFALGGGIGGMTMLLPQRKVRAALRPFRLDAQPKPQTSAVFSPPPGSRALPGCWIPARVAAPGTVSRVHRLCQRANIPTTAAVLVSNPRKRCLFHGIHGLKTLSARPQAKALTSLVIPILLMLLLLIAVTDHGEEQGGPFKHTHQETPHPTRNSP